MKAIIVFFMSEVTVCRTMAIRLWLKLENMRWSKDKIR